MRVLATAAAHILLLLLSGCGSVSSDDAAQEPEISREPVTSNDLDGASFISEQVVGRELVLGSRIKLDVEGDMLGVSAGCNVLFGGLVLEADELRWAGSPRRP